MKKKTQAFQKGQKISLMMGNVEVVSVSQLDANTIYELQDESGFTFSQNESALKRNYELCNKNQIK